MDLKLNNEMMQSIIDKQYANSKYKNYNDSKLIIGGVALPGNLTFG